MPAPNYFRFLIQPLLGTAKLQEPYWNTSANLRRVATVLTCLICGLALWLVGTEMPTFALAVLTPLICYAVLSERMMVPCCVLQLWQVLGGIAVTESCRVLAVPISYSLTISTLWMLWCTGALILLLGRNIRTARI